MSDSELVGCTEHDIRVLRPAKDAWAAIPWSAEKNVIRAMCNNGHEQLFCAPSETDVYVLEIPDDDQEWSNPKKLPDCIDGSRYERFEGLDGLLLTIGIWVVWFDPLVPDPSWPGGSASLRHTVVKDIRFQGDVVRRGLGLA